MGGALGSNELLQLTAHMKWADALVWNTVLGVPAAREDRRIRDLLYHAHTVQWAYLQLLGGEPLTIPELNSFADLDALHRWGRDGHAGLEAFVSSLDEQALGKAVSFPWADQLRERFGEVHGANVRQSILQVAMHTAYHRGQINTRIREVGGEPPLVDFIAWIWAGKPDAPWRAGPE